MITTELKRTLFGILIAVTIYMIGDGFEVRDFILGYWFPLTYRISEKYLYFFLFPDQQKYIIRLMKKNNHYHYEWLVSMNPNDREVKTKKREIALRFNREVEAREAVYLLEHSSEKDSKYYFDVKKYYI